MQPERSRIVAGDDACRSCRCEAGAVIDTKGDGVIVALIIICEVAFWVLLVGGLALRYLAKAPRAGAAVLLCEPLLELVLLVVTAIDLRNGAEPDWKHGLAAVYIGFTVDFRALHHQACGRLVPPPLRGRAAARSSRPGTGRRGRCTSGCSQRGPWAERRSRAALLQLAAWYVGDAGQSDSLRDWQMRLAVFAGINVVVAVSYTLWPRRPKEVPPGRRLMS